MKLVKGYQYFQAIVNQQINYLVYNTWHLKLYYYVTCMSNLIVITKRKIQTPIILVHDVCIVNH